MELWIRSQNKEILQKTNALFIAHSDENIWSIIDNQNMTKYGKYTTRKRALEVLDEIEQFINNGGCSFISQDVQSISLNTYKVFEMPKK